MYRADATFRAIFDKAAALEISGQHPAMLAACWIVTKDDRYAEAPVRALLAGSISRSGGGGGGYSNFWSYALA